MPPARDSERTCRPGRPPRRQDRHRKARAPRRPTGGADDTVPPGVARSGMPGWHTTPSTAAAGDAGQTLEPWEPYPRAGAPACGLPGLRTHTSPCRPHRCPRRSRGERPSRPRRSACVPARIRLVRRELRRGPGATPNGSTRATGHRGFHWGRAQRASCRTRWAQSFLPGRIRYTS